MKRFDYLWGEGYFIIPCFRLEFEREEFPDDVEFYEYCKENSLNGNEVVSLLDSLYRRINELEKEVSDLNVMYEVGVQTKLYSRRKLEEDNKVLKETLADRSSEVALLKCIIDEADDLIQEHCGGYYVGQWLNILRSYGYE